MNLQHACGPTGFPVENKKLYIITLGPGHFPGHLPRRNMIKDSFSQL